MIFRLNSGLEEVKYQKIYWYTSVGIDRADLQKGNKADLFLLLSSCVSDVLKHGRSKNKGQISLVEAHYSHWSFETQRQQTDLERLKYTHRNSNMDVFWEMEHFEFHLDHLLCSGGQRSEREMTGKLPRETRKGWYVDDNYPRSYGTNDIDPNLPGLPVSHHDRIYTWFKLFLHLTFRSKFGSFRWKDYLLVLQATTATVAGAQMSDVAQARCIFLDTWCLHSSGIHSERMEDS